MLGPRPSAATLRCGDVPTPQAAREPRASRISIDEGLGVTHAHPRYRRWLRTSHTLVLRHASRIEPVHLKDVAESVLARELGFWGAMA